jgi:hypothetical protein
MICGLLMGAGLAATTGAFMILLQPRDDSTALAGAVVVGTGRF